MSGPVGFERYQTPPRRRQPFHLGWVASGRSPDLSTGAWPGCLDALAPLFDEGAISRVLGHGVSERKSKLLDGPHSIDRISSLGFDGEWFAYTVHASVILEGRESVVSVAFGEFEFKISLFDGWAESSMNEPLIAQLLGPVVSALNAAVDWQVPISVSPIIRYPSALDVMNGSMRRPDFGWDGTGEGPIRDHLELNGIDVPDGYQQSVELAHSRTPGNDRSDASDSAFLLPVELQSLVDPPVDQMTSFAAVFHDAVEIAEAGDGIIVTSERTASGLVARITLDRQYGVRDAEAADQVVSWFEESVRAGPPRWAVLSPISVPGSSFAKWLSDPERAEAGSPPAAFWLTYVGGEVRRSGVGPLPSRSELDAVQEELFGETAMTVWVDLHSLDELVVPTAQLDQVLGRDVEGTSLAHRRQLGEALLMSGRPDRSWTLIGGNGARAMSLCLTADDWRRVARLLGRDGLHILSSCMGGRFAPTQMLRLSESRVEPVASFLEAHPEAILIPGEHGPVSKAKPVRRPEDVTPGGFVGSLEDVLVQLRDPSGALSREDSIDVATLIDGLSDAARRELVAGSLTVADVDLGPGGPETADAIQAWLEELEGRGVEPDSLVLLAPAPSTKKATSRGPG